MKQHRNKKRSAPTKYTRGELNKIVDSLLHPLSSKNWSYVLLDTFIHALIEQDPPETIQKFIRYNLPKIVRQLTEKTMKSC